jgi:hypothetical protein
MTENMKELKAETTALAIQSGQNVAPAVPVVVSDVKPKKEKKVKTATPQVPTDAPHKYRFKISNYFTPGKGTHSGYTDSLEQIYAIYCRDNTPKPAKVFERNPETQKFDIQLKIPDIKNRLKEALKLS